MGNQNRYQAEAFRRFDNYDLETNDQEITEYLSTARQNTEDSTLYSLDIITVGGRHVDSTGLIEFTSDSVKNDGDPLSWVQNY